MVLLNDLPALLQAEDPEERQLISGVPWDRYEALLSDLGDSLTYRVTYLDGVLELMAPSRRHEADKTNIGSLLEDYFKEARIRYFPVGSTTLRRQQKSSGTEPDESYCLYEDKEFPDLAIEVVVTSGSVNKLEVYRRLGIREVWFFRNGRFEVHCLRDDHYQVMAASELLPALDLAMLARYARAADPLAAALAFRDEIRQRLT
jgi:Uma2 family endonuclease